MNLIDKIVYAHKIKMETQFAINSFNDEEFYGICIQDHYSDPSFSIYLNYDTAESILMRIVDGGVQVVEENINIMANQKAIDMAKAILFREVPDEDV